MSSTRAAPHDPDGIELNHSKCWSQELCCTGCQPNHASGWTGGQGLQPLRGHLCRSPPLPSSSAHSMLESSWTIGSGAPSGPVPDPSRVQHRAARQLQYAAAIASREVKEGLSARAVSAPAQLPWFQRGRASAVGRVCRRVRRGHSQTCGSIEAGGCDACGPGLMGWAEAGPCVCSSHLRVDGHRGLWPDCWSRGPDPRGLWHLNLQPAGSRGPLDPSSTTPFPPPHAAAPAARSAADVLGHVSPGLLPDPHAAIRRPRSGRAATGRRPRQVSHN